MKFTISKGENTLSELTRRIFNLAGPDGAARAAAAEASLLAANSHRTSLDGLPVGAVVIVPSLPEVALASQGEVRALGSEAGWAARARFSGLHEVLDAAVNREIKELKATRKTADRQRGAPGFPDKLIDRIEAAAKNKLDDLSTAVAEHKKGFEQLEQDFDLFLNQLT